MTEENALAADDTVVPEIEVVADQTETTEPDQEAPADSEADNSDAQDAAPDENADTQEPEAKADGESDTGDEKAAVVRKPKKKNRVSAPERISVLTKQRNEAQARAREARAKLSELAPTKPRRDEFEGQEDYDDARALHRARLVDKDRAEQNAKSATTNVEDAKAKT